MADHRRSRSRSGSFHVKRDPHISGEDSDDFIWPPEAPHQEGGEGPGRIGADGRRRIEPDWLGVALAGVHSAGYDMNGSSGQLVIHERNPNHGLDLDSMCAHTTAFVRSVIPYLYGEIPGFLEAYSAELANWACSPRVMTVWKTNRRDERDEDYIVHVPPFPLRVHTQANKPLHYPRFWELTLPAEITPNSKKYPAPDVLPVDLARSSLTGASIAMLQNRRNGGTYGPVTVRHYLYTTSNWTLAASYKDPRNRDAGDRGSLRARNDSPPESTSWIATLAGRPGERPVKVLVTFDERLTEAHERLRDEVVAERREREEQEMVLGKGRREYKPLARALF